MSTQLIKNITFGILLITLGFVVGLRFRSDSVALSLTPPQTLINTIPTGSQVNSVDFGLFWQVWDKLSQTYVDKKALVPQTMVYGAISGMVASLGDPYTVFLPPKENKEAKDELGGNFEGIGAQLGIKDKKIVIASPLKDMPAAKAGLKSGDWIVKVNNEETMTWTLPQAVAKIRGPKGSSVTLTIARESMNKPFDVTLVRDAIHVASVDLEYVQARCTTTGCEQIKEGCSDCIQVAWLKLSRFGDTTMSEWNTAVANLAQKNCALTNTNCKGIVFDLRNNPGGYLNTSVDIASEFLPDGVVVIQDNNNGTRETRVVRDNRKGLLLKEPLVVLVNQGSASAAEIVSGALKVRGRARLVGVKTFGKGSVQETQDIQNGAGLHITVARWLLPDGTQINGKGVEPNVVIDLPDKELETDIQLNKAITELVNPSTK